MTIKKIILSLAVATTLSTTFTSCFKDLDRKPKYGLSSAAVYENFDNYKGVLAKIYGGLALTGQNGPAGNGDLAGIDEGFSSYVRVFWKLQEVPTDEAILGWGDPGLPVLNTGNWSATNDWTTAMYYRISYQITLCNEFIRETSDEKLAERNITGAQADEARVYRNEARFMRALSYYHALDMYRNFPFTTENDKIGTDLPKQGSASEIYSYVESELLAIEPGLAAPKTNEYGRADKAAAWMLLSKLYLNSNVYVGVSNYDKVATYTTKVINAGYQLATDYAHNFMADNHTSPEMILTVNFDGIHSRTYGGTTFLTHAAVGGSMQPSEFGIDGGWGGLRTRKAFVDKFNGLSGDKRAMFYTNGQDIENNTISKFTDGYAITKWKNITKDTSTGSDLTFVDIDFPLFRLADAYLMYAEAAVRNGAGASKSDAAGYINLLRERASGNSNNNIAESDLTLDFILDERARELYWEGSRRTDLIRFGKFTSSDYVWSWKGGSLAGSAMESFRTVFPIPALDLAANPNLKQNTGY